MMNTLPKYFAIKWSGNPLWKEYIKWLNKTYNRTLQGGAIRSYYGFGGFNEIDEQMYNTCLINFKNLPTEITLEQWDSIVNKKDDFVLPERWCVKVTKENAKILGDFYAEHSYEGYRNLIPNREIGKYYTSHNVSSDNSIFNPNCGSYFDIFNPNDKFKEITFEQFKKYVLKQDDMNKEIIGYKLIKPEYKKAACQIEGYIQCGEGNIITKIFSLNTHEFAINKWKQAGVLDLWFEPVYKEEKKLPVIGSFEGSYQNGVITYGCQSFSSEFIKTIVNADSIDNITIKGVLVTKQQIKEIYEYINSKD